MAERILIVEKKGLSPMWNFPDILLQKHFLQQEISAKSALGLSTDRGHFEPHLMHNTVFEKPRELWKCVVIRDNSGLVQEEEEVYISGRKLQTYQCYRKPYKANEWIVEDIGKNYAVFGTDYSDYHFIEESLNADSVEIREEGVSQWIEESDEDMDYDDYYDCDGYNCDGYNCDGYNCDGYDCGGYNCDGYNCDGYNCCGYNCDGYNCDGYNCHGYNCHGYNCDCNY